MGSADLWPAPFVWAEPLRFGLFIRIHFCTRTNLIAAEEGDRYGGPTVG